MPKFLGKLFGSAADKQAARFEKIAKIVELYNTKNVPITHNSSSQVYAAADVNRAAEETIQNIYKKLKTEYGAASDSSCTVSCTRGKTEAVAVTFLENTVQLKFITATGKCSILYARDIKNLNLAIRGTDRGVIEFTKDDHKLSVYLELGKLDAHFERVGIEAFQEQMELLAKMQDNADKPIQEEKSDFIEDPTEDWRARYAYKEVWEKLSGTTQKYIERLLQMWKLQGEKTSSLAEQLAVYENVPPPITGQMMERINNEARRVHDMDEKAAEEEAKKRAMEQHKQKLKGLAGAAAKILASKSTTAPKKEC